jgi:hypothetical protein
MKKHELAERVTAAVMREIHDGSPIERSRSFLPLSTNELILPAQCAEITATPQRPFRGDRLAIWSGCAASFFINAIRTGIQYQGAQAGDIPADAFATRLDLLPILDAKFQKDGFVEVRISKRAEECFGQQLAMPLCPLGGKVILVVTNVGDKPLSFTSVILGDVEYQ